MQKENRSNRCHMKQPFDVTLLTEISSPKIGPEPRKILFKPNNGEDDQISSLLLRKKHLLQSADFGDHICR